MRTEEIRVSHRDQVMTPMPTFHHWLWGAGSQWYTTRDVLARYEDFRSGETVFVVKAKGSEVVAP